LSEQPKQSSATASEVTSGVGWVIDKTQRISNSRSSPDPQRFFPHVDDEPSNQDLAREKISALALANSGDAKTAEKLRALL
jgi:hypothetical protein